MKKILSLLIPALLICPLTKAKAQLKDTIHGPYKEFYVSFADFSPVSINLKYKKQIRQATYFKIGFVSLSANVNGFTNNGGAAFPITSQNYSGGLELGIEFRKSITKKLSFYHGPSLRGIYQYSLNKNLNPGIPQAQQKVHTGTITGAVPYTLGLLCQVYANFYAAIEINPAINGSYQRTGDDIKQTSNSYSGGFSFDNRFALLSLVYRY